MSDSDGVAAAGGLVAGDFRLAPSLARALSGAPVRVGTENPAKLDAVRLAHRLGVEFAFPTRTLYMRQGEDTPLPLPDGDFAPTEAEAQARNRGRKEARAIVAATLGEGVRPPPVGPRGEVHQGE